MCSKELALNKHKTLYPQPRFDCFLHMNTHFWKEIPPPTVLPPLPSPCPLHFVYIVQKKREVFSLSATWGISGRSCLIGESDSRINSTHALNPIPEQKKTLSLTGIQTPRGMKRNNIRLKLEMKDSFCHRASRIADLLRLYWGESIRFIEQNRLIFHQMFLYLTHHTAQDRVWHQNDFF